MERSASLRIYASGCRLCSWRGSGGNRDLRSFEGAVDGALDPECAEQRGLELGGFIVGLGRLDGLGTTSNGRNGNGKGGEDL